MNKLPTFEMDLYADWILCLREALDKAGFAEQAERGDDHICIDYFRVIQRQISVKRRKVVRSKDFICPSEYEAGLEMLEAEIVEGRNLNPRLSRHMRHLLFNDNMLNDWGLHHFHLGETSIKKVKANGMVEGTRDLVYAKVEPDIIYLARVMRHNEWSNIELFEAIQVEWPFLFEPFRLAAVNAFPKFSAKEREKMREIGFTIVTETTDGQIFTSPGGGVSIGGTSIDAVMRSDNFSRMLRGLKDEIRQKYLLQTQIFGATDLPSYISLRVTDKQIVLVDKHETTFYESGVEVPPLLSFKVQTNT